MRAIIALSLLMSSGCLPAPRPRPQLIHATAESCLESSRDNGGGDTLRRGDFGDFCRPGNGAMLSLEWSF